MEDMGKMLIQLSKHDHEVHIHI